MKINLTDLSNLQNETTAVNNVNDNNAVLESAFDNTLSRDGTAPNQMEAALDMNSNQIYNLPAPSTTSSPARLIDVVSNPTIVIPGTGTSGHVVPFLDTNNSWSGQQHFNDVPWVDVKSAAYGAKGDNATPDDTAIQAAIDHMYSVYGGGVVFFPPGSYVINTGIVVKGGVRLVGSGKVATAISAFNYNVPAITFNSSCVRGCSLEHMLVQGYFNANTSLVTTNAVTVAANVALNTYDVHIFYGNSAMFTLGVDGCHTHTWFCGCVNNVVSQGANWYIRCMFNENGAVTSATNQFIQGTSANICENHFSQCDFSGSATNSVSISGGVGANLTIFEGCIFANPISIGTAYWTSFVGCELGATINLNGGTGGTVSVVGCCGFLTTLTLTGNFVKAGNFNIT